VEVETTAPFAKMVRHLQQLKRALDDEDIAARLDSTGGSNVVLQVPGVPGDVTCRTNAADGHHWWYWHDNEPFAAAHDAEQAREATKKVLELRAEAPAQ
jgi:hypothetical protein